MKDTNSNPFDDQIRQSLEGFEMPYNAAAWTQFEAMLPAQPTPSAGNAGWLKGAAVVALIAAVGAVVYTIWPAQPNAELANKAAQQEVVAQEAVAPVPSTTNSTLLSSESEKSEPTKVGTSTGGGDAKMAANQEERIISAVSANPPSTTEQNGSSEQSNPPAPQKAESTPQAEVSLTLKMSKTSVCEGEQVSFTPGASTGGMRYSWTFGDGEQSTKSAPVKAFDNAGTYEVKLTATKEERTWERTETIEVKPAPVASITGMETMKGNLPLVTLKAELQDGESCTWAFGDGRLVTESEVRHLFRKRDAAVVTLTVANGQGCTSSEKKKVPMAEDFKLFANSAFTPNGDVTNEVFLPKALEAMECDFEMIIRDAKGTIVFRTSSVNQPWDGRDLGGVLQPKGSYFWTVVLKEAILTDRVFTGDIKLMQ